MRCVTGSGLRARCCASRRRAFRTPGRHAARKRELDVPSGAVHGDVRHRAVRQPRPARSAAAPEPRRAGRRVRPRQLHDAAGVRLLVEHRRLSWRPTAPPGPSRRPGHSSAPSGCAPTARRPTACDCRRASSLRAPATRSPTSSTRATAAGPAWELHPHPGRRPPAVPRRDRRQRRLHRRSRLRPRLHHASRDSAHAADHCAPNHVTATPRRGAPARQAEHLRLGPVPDRTSGDRRALSHHEMLASDPCA